MIYCKKNELLKFSSYSAYFEEAVNFILTQDLNSIPLGITEIDGTNVYLNKCSILSKKRSDILYEEHHQYVDIHIDVCGNEIIDTTEQRDYKIDEYDKEHDCIQYSKGTIESSVRLINNYCAIYFPYEIHKPGIVNTSKNTTKCIFKIIDICSNRSKTC